MEYFKLLEKNGILFNVGNKGTIQVLDRPVGKLIKTLEDRSQFSETGGHEGKRYLSTHGHYIHRLVAEAWIGPIPEGYEVNHKSTNKHDNSVENLEIVTPKMNHQHAWDSGIRDHLRSTKKRKKLHNEWIVYDLNFNIISQHDSREEAAKSINVSRQAAHSAFIIGRPILRNFHICKPTQVEELRQKIRTKVA